MKQQSLLKKTAKVLFTLSHFLSLKVKLIILLIASFLFVSSILLVGISSMLVEFANEENAAKENNSSSLFSFSNMYSFGTAQVSSDVEQYRNDIEQELKKYKKEDLLDVVLAQMMQESGGQGNDPMQASESKCGHIGCITNPDESIEQGVKYFLEVYERANEDIQLTLQSYNFGQGFIDYVQKNGGSYTKELAIEFSQMKYQELKHTGIYVCHRPESFEHNACYGDISYVDAVMQYLPSATLLTSDIEASVAFKKVLNEIEKYEGFAYVFGGNNPDMSFDCSGLMQWGFKQIGLNLPRTAEEQYNFSEKIDVEEARPGDLVFFIDTYKAGVSHVGLYLGDGKMYDTSGNPEGVGIKDFTTGYWQEHFYAFGRVADFSEGEN